MSNFMSDIEQFQPPRGANLEARAADGPQTGTRQPTLRECVASSLGDYLDRVNHEDISDLYELVLSAVEAPLLETVMQHTRSNQSKASAMLGLNRGTLRKKLKKYGMLN